MQRMLVGLAALLLLAGCARDPAAETGVPVVQPVALVSVVHQEQMAIEREFAGLVTAAQSSELGFELGGKVAQLLVDEGQTVDLGQPLARLDTRLLEAQRSELQGRLAELQAGITLNQVSTRRVAELEDRGFASQQSSDELDAEGDSLQARSRQVQAELRANQTRLEQSRLVAPYAGVVSRRFVDQGAVVAAGTPVIRLLQSAGLEARVGVPVSLAGTLVVGEPARLRIGGQELGGTILAMGNDLNPSTQTLPVRVAIADQTTAVPGDQAYLLLQQQIDSAGFWVPMESLTDGLRGLWNVYVAIPGDTSESLLIEARDVRVLHAELDRAFVAGALGDGEQVVAAGVHRLVPGQRVVAAALADSAVVEVARWSRNAE